LGNHPQLPNVSITFATESIAMSDEVVMVPVPDEQAVAPAVAPAPEPQVVPPKMPTPRFKNPEMDRIFARAKRRVKTVPVTIRFTDEATGQDESETVNFLVHEMSAGMKGRFEAIMQEQASRLMGEDDDDLSNDGKIDPEALAAKVTTSANMGSFKVAVVAASVTDMDGNPIIAQSEIDTACDLPAYFIEVLFEEAFTLAGLGRPKETEKAAENG
jgi:hypothetical protein